MRVTKIPPQKFPAYLTSLLVTLLTVINNIM